MKRNNLLLGLALVFGLLGPQAAHAQSLSLHSYSGVTDPSNILGSGYGVAGDTGACPAGWTLDSGVCKYGTTWIEGWAVFEATDSWVCSDINVEHSADTLTFPAKDECFYVFASQNPPSTSWVYLGQACSGSLSASTTVFDGNDGTPYTQILLGRQSDLSRPDTRWYDIYLTNFCSNCCI